jgi:5-methylcytosine-specific restriction endonuclease McrA
MIRHRFSRAKLERLIAKESPAWMADAKVKTAAFRALKKYVEKTGSWGKIKQVYMMLQHGKCAYCERKVGDDKESRIEHDVEHFRPKSKVRSWPAGKRATQLSYAFATGGASNVGYYLLAYNISNYAVTCKKCNTTYKSNYFPVAGAARCFKDDNPKSLAKEQPFLIYPLGDLDADPEDLITFQGLVAVPMADVGHDHDRARVTIDFFMLAVGRDELLRERAVLLKALYWAIDDLKTTRNPKRRAAARQTVRMALSRKNPHTNCLRSFFKLCRTDPQIADQYYDAIYEYLQRKGL